MPKKQPGKKPAGAKKAGPSTLITFVLDRSGSMASMADAAISGFNEFKAERAGDPGETRMTLMMFEDDHEYICSAVPVAEVADLDHQTYRPGATTALYDAVGTAILEADAYLDAAAAKPDQVLFVILTDGLENASREFDQKRVFEMIRDRQKTREYDFLYLGANQDSYAESERMGVQSGRNMDWEATPDRLRHAMARASHGVSAYKAEGTTLREDWFAPAENAAFEAEWERREEERRNKQGGKDAS